MNESEYLIELWVYTNNLEKSTLKTYLHCLKKYCELAGKSPHELIKEAEEDQQKILKVRDRKISKYFLMFKKNLEDDGKAEGTIRLYINAVRSFYDALEIQLPRNKAKKGDISLEKNKGRLLTHKDLITLTNIAPIREKTLIYLMALSGMAQAEARNITIKRFLEICGDAINQDISTVEQLFNYEDRLSNEILTISLRRKKVNYEYITFIPPEATITIIHYLKERVNGINKKIRIKDINRPIFVKNNGEPLDSDTIVTNFRNVGLEAGYKKEKGAFSYWRAHGMRKYFISTIVNEIGDWELANFLVGHKIPDVNKAYWYVNPEKLKQKYQKILPYLSIDGAKVRDIKSEEFKKLEAHEKILDEIQSKMLKSERIYQSLMENPDLLRILKERMKKTESYPELSI
jgi:site-specific recombinase XerD